MTETQFLIAAFAVLIFGLLLPLPHGARWTLFLLLIGLGVLAAVGGGVQHFTDLFD
ncbi:MAG TPA: hypothetical protein VGS13_04705 [Stellaceae bacterium]|nr:hypothetical protein [Stellaceae bacterium]